MSTENKNNEDKKAETPKETPLEGNIADEPSSAPELSSDKDLGENEGATDIALYDPEGQGVELSDPNDLSSMVPLTMNAFVKAVDGINAELIDQLGEYEAIPLEQVTKAYWSPEFKGESKNMVFKGIITLMVPPFGCTDPNAPKEPLAHAVFEEWRFDQRTPVLSAAKRLVRQMELLPVDTVVGITYTGKEKEKKGMLSCRFNIDVYKKKASIIA